MTDAQFYNSHAFHLLTFTRYHATDATNGAPLHFFARMVRGTAKIWSEGCTLHLSPGDIFYIPKGLSYRSYWYLDAGGANSFYTFGTPLLPADTAYRLQKLDCDGAALALFEELASDPCCSPEAIGRFYRFYGAAAHSMSPADTTRSKTVDRALRFMQANPSCTVGELAHACGVSESGLYAAFKKALGRTPLQERHRLLVTEAADLLGSTDLTVEEISERLGFSSSSYFRKVLRAETGRSPREIRQETNKI